MGFDVQSWLWTLLIGMPILVLAARRMLNRASASVLPRLVLCVMTACVFMPVGIDFGGGLVILPAVVMIGYIITGGREGFRIAIDAGIFPIVLASLLLLGIWSMLLFIRKLTQKDVVKRAHEADR
jgi:hypothetical protein